jgi:hypothetical protein
MPDFASLIATQRLTVPVGVGDGELVRATGLPLTVVVGVGVADAVGVVVGVAVAVAVAVVVVAAGASGDFDLPADLVADAELADVLRVSVVVAAGVVVAGSAFVGDCEVDVDDRAVVVVVVVVACVGLGLVVWVVLVLLGRALDVALAGADVEGPGAGDGSVLAVPDAEPLDLGAAEPLVDVFALAETLGDPLDVDGDGVVAVGLGVVVVGVVVVGVGLGDGVAACTGSHCCTVPLAAAAVSARPAGWTAVAASDKPVAVAARTPPVTRPTTTGCTCAIRMRGPAPAFRCSHGTSARAVRPRAPADDARVTPLLPHHSAT